MAASSGGATTGPVAAPGSAEWGEWVIRRAAALGVSPKLFRDSCPEVKEQHEQFEAAFRKARAQQLGAMPLGIFYALVHGVRGQAGVAWIGPLLLRDLASLTADELKDYAQNILLPLYRQVSEGKPPTWASHREGPNHPVMTGGYFLLKLGGSDAEAAITGVLKAAARMAPYIQRLLEASVPIEFSAHEQLGVLTAFDQTLLLGDRGRVSGYNSMDKGRCWLAWALHSDRLQGLLILPEVFDHVAYFQSGGFAGLEPFGVRDFATFTALHKEIQQVATSPLPLEDTRVSWPFLFVHLCETKQTVKTLTAAVVDQALREEQPQKQAVLYSKLEHLLENGVSGSCFMLTLVRLLRPPPPRARALRQSRKEACAEGANDLQTEQSQQSKGAIAAKKQRPQGRRGAKGHLADDEAGKEVAQEEALEDRADAGRNAERRERGRVGSTAQRRARVIAGAKKGEDGILSSASVRRLIVPERKVLRARLYKGYTAVTQDGRGGSKILESTAESSRPGLLQLWPLYLDVELAAAKPTLALADVKSMLDDKHTPSHHGFAPRSLSENEQKVIRAWYERARADEEHQLGGALTHASGDSDQDETDDQDQTESHIESDRDSDPDYSPGGSDTTGASAELPTRAPSTRAPAAAAARQKSLTQWRKIVDGWLHGPKSDAEDSEAESRRMDEEDREAQETEAMMKEDLLHYNDPEEFDWIVDKVPKVEETSASSGSDVDATADEAAIERTRSPKRRRTSELAKERGISFKEAGQDFWNDVAARVAHAAIASGSGASKV